MMQTGRTIHLLEQVTRLNLEDPLRNGQTLCFPGSGELFVSTDMHNHRKNFERFMRAAHLKKTPERHVILQELIHGGALGKDGEDTSFELLFEALEWARDCPGQVHFLLANHDMAQVLGLAVMKDGYDLTDRFNRYIDIKFGSSGDKVRKAYADFVYSLPLAAITVTGLFFSHSLPGPRELATFDNSILRRELTRADYVRNGPVHQLIWGRHQTQEVLNRLSKAWWADAFICGHQGQESGVGVIGDRMLIIDSSHNHGTYMRLNLAKQYTFPDLKNEVQPIASIG